MHSLKVSLLISMSISIGALFVRPSGKIANAVFRKCRQTAKKD